MHKIILIIKLYRIKYGRLMTNVNTLYGIKVDFILLIIFRTDRFCVNLRLKFERMGHNECHLNYKGK